MAPGDVAARSPIAAGGGPGARIGVLVLSEHDLVRQGLVDLVTAEPDMVVVGAAPTAEVVVAALAGSAPQVVLVDTQLPDNVGITGCRQMIARHPELHCLLLTSFDDDEALFSAVMAGAAGFLVKEVGGSKLPDGIRAVAEGCRLLDAVVVGRLLDRLRQTGLDEYEKRVLELVGRGSTDVQIAAELGRGGDEVRDDVTALTSKLAQRRREPEPRPPTLDGH